MRGLTPEHKEAVKEHIDDLLTIRDVIASQRYLSRESAANQDTDVLEAYIRHYPETAFLALFLFFFFFNSIHAYRIKAYGEVRVVPYAASSVLLAGGDSIDQIPVEQIIGSRVAIQGGLRGLYTSSSIMLQVTGPFRPVRSVSHISNATMELANER